MTVPIIETVVPEVFTPVPQRTQGQADFDANADAFFASLPGVATGINAVSEEINEAATFVDLKAQETDADRIATAADRVQTGLDRQATGADRTATAADRQFIEWAVDQFDDRYLGAKTEDPLADNDGNPLQIGAIYLNSVTGFLRIYSTMGWFTFNIADESIRAALAADSAELARDMALFYSNAALAASNTFVSTAAGLAGTVADQVFLVTTADPQVYTVYRNNAGVALLLGTLNIADGSRFVVSSRTNDNAFSVSSKGGRVLAKLDRVLGWVFGGKVTVAGDLISQTKTESPLGDFEKVNIALMELRKGFNRFVVATKGGRVFLSLKSDGILRSFGAYFESLSVKDISVSGTALFSGELAAGIFSTGLNKIKTGLKPFRIFGKSGRVVLGVDSFGTVQAPEIKSRFIDTDDMSIAGKGIDSYVSERSGIVVNTNSQVGVSQTSIDYFNQSPPPKPAIVIPGASLFKDPIYFDLTAVGVPACTWTGSRLWVIAYGHNFKTAGASAIPIESFGAHTVLKYCDNPFDAIPVFHNALAISNTNTFVDPADGQTKRYATGDPQVFAMPDGRLFVTYTTGKVSSLVPEYERGGYGFFINNPQAKSGQFEVGRQSFIDLGVPMRPHVFGSEVWLNVDEWSVNIHVDKLVSDGFDGFTVERVANVPRFADSDIFESSLVPISGGRVRVYQRTNIVGQQIYTSLSNAGVTTFPTPTYFGQFTGPTSRSCFVRSNSGRVVGAFNQFIGGDTSGRKNMTLAISENESETFFRNYVFDSSSAISYPSISFSPRGEVVVAYDLGRSGNFLGGPKIRVAMLDEEKVFNQTITPADVRIINAFDIPQTNF